MGLQAERFDNHTTAPLCGSGADPFVEAITDVVIVLDRMAKVQSVLATGLTGGAEGVARAILARTPEAAIGQYFPDLLQEDRREIVARALSRMRIGTRLTPLSLRFDGAEGIGPAVILFGARLADQNGLFHLGLINPTGSLTRLLAQRDPETSLLEREAFLARATALLEDNHPTAASLNLSLIDIGGAARQRRHLEPEHSQAFSNQLGTRLQGLSVGGDFAGITQADRLMLIHSADITTAQIKQALTSLIAPLPSHTPALPVLVITLPLTPTENSPAESLALLAHTLEQFAHQGASNFAPVRPQGEALSALILETQRQMSLFGRYVLPSDFSLAFQPIVSLQTGQIKHYEALARFTDGSKTDLLVGYAEQVGLVEEFDLAVVGKVLWAAETLPEHSPPVAINLSGRSLQSRGFTGALMIALDACNLPPSRILFEITETADIERLGDVNDAIQSLRQRGHKVCLDDFGVGSAALPYLRQLDVDALKIDGSYIDTLLTNPRDRAIVRAIVGLAHHLGLEVIAERVESHAQSNMLLEMGVTLGQGYLFARPSPTMDL